MGVCYVSKGPQQIVVNSKLNKNQVKSDISLKSNLLLIKTTQLIDFKNKIRQLYYNNSLRNIALNNFMTIIKDTKKEKILEKKLSYLFSHISLSLIEEGALKDILTISFCKLSIIFPKSKKFKLIWKIIYFFICKRNYECNKKRKKFLNKIINYSLISFDDEYYNEQNESMIKNMVKASIYSTKKLTLIITNLLLFLSYFTLYFFITPAVFEIFYNFNENKLKELLVDKLDIDNIKQNEIESIVFHILKLINPEFSRNLFIVHSIYYVCCPLKKYILDHPTQKIFELDENNKSSFNEFLKKMDDIFSLDTILELIYSNETKES
jgi:hypothetical protein